jgi:hypothetical protein
MEGTCRDFRLGDSPFHVPVALEANGSSNTCDQ